MKTAVEAAELLSLRAASSATSPRQPHRRIRPRRGLVVTGEARRAAAEAAMEAALDRGLHLPHPQQRVGVLTRLLAGLSYQTRARSRTNPTGVIEGVAGDPDEDAGVDRLVVQRG